MFNFTSLFYFIFFPKENIEGGEQRVERRAVWRELVGLRWIGGIEEEKVALG